jgi:transposase
VDEVMIVLGADTHKRSHTIAAVELATGQVLGEKTVGVGARGFAALVIWARGLDGERVWALEDCRHVSGALERFLISRGERVVRVSTRLMAGTRRSSRDRGKSDRIDAIAVARAALAVGIERLPTAALAGRELDLRLLVDHRERLVRTRVALNSTLQWNLHDLWPELQLPGGALFSNKWTTKLGRRLARAEQTMRVRIARDELRRLRELTAAIKALEAEIAELVTELAPQLVAEPGCGPLTAAKLVGEIAGASRFTTDAKLARAAGTAPIPASSGRTDRHRLDRGGNRQINAAIHRMAVTRARCDAQTQDYIARKKAEGKTQRDALRCLKRHLTRRVWQLLRAPNQATTTPPQSVLLDIGAAEAAARTGARLRYRHGRIPAAGFAAAPWHAAAATCSKKRRPLDARSTPERSDLAPPAAGCAMRLELAKSLHLCTFLVPVRHAPTSAVSGP